MEQRFTITVGPATELPLKELTDLIEEISNKFTLTDKSEQYEYNVLIYINQEEPHKNSLSVTKETIEPYDSGLLDPLIR